MEHSLFMSYDSRTTKQLKDENIKPPEVKRFYDKVYEERTRSEMDISTSEVTSAVKSKNNSKDSKKEKIEATRKKYTHKEVLSAAIEYFEGDELAANVWMNKYALKDSDGNIYELTPDDMHHRIAGEVARIENNYPNPLTEKEIFEVINKFRYIVPQGSPMAGIGNTFQASSLSNCFVIGNDGDKNQTWYAKITRSNLDSGSRLISFIGGGSRYTDSGNTSKNLKNGQGNG